MRSTLLIKLAFWRNSKFGDVVTHLRTIRFWLKTLRHGPMKAYSFFKLSVDLLFPKSLKSN